MKSNTARHFFGYPTANTQPRSHTVVVKNQLWLKICELKFNE